MTGKMDDYVRQALWEVHGKKCFYCTDQLMFKNVHLDHVIPQHLYKQNPTAIKVKYRLPELFDFDALDNLAPSCQSCNSRRKRAIEFEMGIPMWLELIGNKKGGVEQLAIKIRHELTLDLPDDYREFFLSSPDFLLSELSIEVIRKKDVPLYKELAFNPSFDRLELVSPDSTAKVVIHNLKQYEYYTERGYYALTTNDISFSSICDACLSFFEVFQKAVELPTRLSLHDYYRQLPIELLWPCSTEEREYLCKNFETLADYIEQSEIKIESNSNSSLKLILDDNPNNFRQTGYIIKEILQADFSGNGNIEALLFVHYQSGGTLNYTNINRCFLKNGKWELVEC